MLRDEVTAAQWDLRDRVRAEGTVLRSEQRAMRAAQAHRVRAKRPRRKVPATAP